MIGSSRPTVDYNIIASKPVEAWILKHYFDINTLPYRMSSPLREDKKPSFGLVMFHNNVFYKDFATGESGNLLQLLSRIWNIDIASAASRVLTEYKENNNNTLIIKDTKKYHKVKNTTTTLKVKTREWKDHDIEYWNSYGISINWLEYANVYPISHIFITKNKKTTIINAEKYAYTYIERKEGHITLKIYQPFSKEYKWMSKHDGSVISLWTKIPKKGDILCICSSVKDALCLSCNLHIPAIALQGEGYNMSDTAIKALKKRYNRVYIFFDNDKPGIEDAKKLSTTTGFEYKVLPSFEGGKDISDMYKVLGKEKMIALLKPLFE